jgi:predicted lipoprotein with Yx(FWY)xxD motif
MVLGLAGCGGSAPPTSDASHEAPSSSATFLYLTRVQGLGPVLVDAGHRTLYRFGGDVRGSGKSRCYGACARTWRPVLTHDPRPAGESGAFHPDQLRTIERRDGIRQVTYFGWPLYTYAPEGRLQSEGAGLRSFGGTWFALRVRGGSVR